jgi:hypothetical protein
MGRIPEAGGDALRHVSDCGICLVETLPTVTVPPVTIAVQKSAQYPFQNLTRPQENAIGERLVRAQGSELGPDKPLDPKD